MPKVNPCLISFLLLSTVFLSSLATNRKTAHILTDGDNTGDDVKIELMGYTNSGGTSTFMQINVFPGDSILKINKIEWEKIDTVYSTLEPVSETLNYLSFNGEKIYWTLEFDFPYTQFFNHSDKLAVYTDRGVFRILSSEVGQKMEEIKNLKESQNRLLLQKEQDENKIEKYRSLWVVFLIVSIVMLITSLIFLKGYLKIKRNRRIELKELREKLEEKSHQNLILEKSNSKLNQSKFDTLNAICDEYYEKDGSDPMKITVYNNVKNLIFSYTEKKKIEELQDYVNTYQDSVMTKIKDQLSGLPSADIIFLTYILCGFSPKTICVLTNLNIKQFYYRRSKLKEQILASNAPDKDLFVSKI